MVYVFCASLATGLAQTCSACTGVNPVCLNSSMNCSSAYPNCITASFRMSFDGSNQDSLQKLCSGSDLCNKEGTANFGKVKLFGRTQCCTADYCNKDTQFSIPDMSTTPNGRSCKTCYGLTAADCVNSAEVQCTGNQDRCLTASGTRTTAITGEKFYISGCASPDFCDSAVQNALNYVSIFVENTTCSSAMGTHRNNPMKNRMILLASAAMLALKLYF